MHNRLAQLGLPHVWDDYGAGGHAWYYWQRDLRETVPDMMKTLAHPPAAPSPFDFRAIESSYSVYGWRVRIDRPALEFSELRGASARGFKLLGSGTAKVRTASYYKPGSTVRVSVRTGAGTKTLKLKAGDKGRVTVAVPIGPGTPDQEYSPAAAASGTSVYAAKVTLRGRRAR
jgi:hypothetical protein